MSDDRFKFRVWYNSRFDNKGWRMANVCSFHINKNKVIIANPPFGNTSIDLNHNAILEQCTGLKDKNGNLIYEGDVVRYYRSTAMGLGGERIASVRWDDRSGSWWILTTLGDGYAMYDALNFGIEIIGNVHGVNHE